MKVLLNCHTPFAMAHGGHQVQIEQTKSGLEQIGVQVEYLRWWDESQTGDIIHQVGFLTPDVVSLAKTKGIKVAMTILLSESANRPKREQFLRNILLRCVLSSPLPARIKNRLPWSSFHLCDKVIVGLEAERRVLQRVYGVPQRQISVIPLGLSDSFLEASPSPRTGDYLVCAGSIVPVKNCLKLALLAKEAKTPVLFVGKPQSEGDQYWKEFQGMVDGQMVRHHSHVEAEAEMIALMRNARGYVLMSSWENWSLTAHEATACGLPLLLQDQPWARERFGTQAAFFPKKDRARALRQFYDEAPRLSAPRIQLYSWKNVAEMLRSTYSEILN